MFRNINVEDYDLDWDLQKACVFRDCLKRVFKFSIENDKLVHKKIIYDDKKHDYTNFDIQPYNEHFIKLIVLNKTNNEVFDKFVERLYNEISVHDLNIVEDYSDIKASVREDILEMGEDTVTFLNNYVDQLETDINTTKLKEYLKSIYIEASDNNV